MFVDLVLHPAMTRIEPILQIPEPTQNGSSKFFSGNI